MKLFFGMLCSRCYGWIYTDARSKWTSIASAFVVVALSSCSTIVPIFQTTAQVSSYGEPLTNVKLKAPQNVNHPRDRYIIDRMVKEFSKGNDALEIKNFTINDKTTQQTRTDIVYAGARSSSYTSNVMNNTGGYRTSTSSSIPIPITSTYTRHDYGVMFGLYSGDVEKYQFSLNFSSTDDVDDVLGMFWRIIDFHLYRSKTEPNAHTTYYIECVDKEVTAEDIAVGRGHYGEYKNALRIEGATPNVTCFLQDSPIVHTGCWADSNFHCY